MVPPCSGILPHLARRRRTRLGIDCDERRDERANKRNDSGRKNEDVVETDLTIEVPRQANLDVEAFSSPVIVRDVSGSRHRVKTFSGAQTLERLSGALDAGAFSGSIALVAMAWTGSEPLKLDTFSGHIDVQVPATAGGSLEFDTFSGDFSTDAPLTLRSKAKRTVRADFPGSDAAKGTLRLHTFSGDVRVRK